MCTQSKNAFKNDQITSLPILIIRPMLNIPSYNSLTPNFYLMMQFSIDRANCLLTALLKVLMKDITTPVPAEEMKKIIQKSLEKAALINYTQLTDYAQFEGYIYHIAS